MRGEKQDGWQKSGGNGRCCLLFSSSMIGQAASASRWDAGPPRKVDRIDLDQAPFLLPLPVDGTPPPKRWGRGLPNRTEERACRGIRCQLSALTVAQQRIVDTCSGDYNLFIVHKVHSCLDISMFELSNMPVLAFSTVTGELCSVPHVTQLQA